MTSSDIEQTNLGLGTKKFQQGCQHCIPFVERNILGEKTKFINCFGTLSGKLWDTKQNFFARIVGNASCNSTGTFREYKKPEHVHSGMADSGEKTQPYEGKNFQS